MASYHGLLQHTKPRLESPAKVFAKLKSKVQREGMCAKEGTFTGNESLCNVREKHGAVFMSPRMKTERIRMTNELKENQRSGCYHNEAQPLTLSPISSPQKIFRYSDISSKQTEEMYPMTKKGHGCTPRKRAFLESTAVSHPSSVVNRQILTEPVQIMDLSGFNVISRTPVKIQPVGKDCVFEEGCAPLGGLMSPACVLTPSKKRLKKRKWEPQEFNKVCSSTKEFSNVSISQPQERNTSSAFSERNNTCMEDLENVDVPSEKKQLTHEPMFLSPRSTAVKRCSVDLDTFPLMSPAKMFAYMKKRECKTKQQEVDKVSSSSTGDDWGRFHQSRDTPPPSIARTIGEMEDVAFSSAAPASQAGVESADSQSDTDPSEDVLSPAVSPQPVLLEDPLVLNTPRISIPKKQEAVFKRKKWLNNMKFPSESVIYLNKWFLRRNHKGLFVDGIHWKENIPWNSNIIVDRVSQSVLKTVSGRVYILVGKMNTSAESGFPKWLLKKFANGFPPDWKLLYEKFLSESKDERSRETERKSEGRSVTSRTKPEASSVVRSVKQHRQKSVKTRDTSLPASLSRANVSRSGRVIKPPLEYWKGGRVMLDAHMNVTIHECYDTSICIPVTTTMSTRASQKPARVFLPCSDGKGRKQCEPANGKEASVPLRKSKALHHKRSAKVKPEEKPSYSPEPSVKTLSSPEERQAAERTLYVDPVPQKQSDPEKPSTRRSKRQTHDTTRPPVRVLGRKRAVPAFPGSANDGTSPSSDDGVTGRKKPAKEAHRKRSRRVIKKPSYKFSSSESSQSSDEIKKELGKRSRVTQTKHKQSKRTKSQSTTKPLPQSTQSSKNKPKTNRRVASVPQQQDADEWTETELMKLQEAVSYYPKHMAGYWAKVARMVGTRSAEECHYQHTSQGTIKTPAKKAKKKMEAPTGPDHPVISARVGTLRRKQQVRQFLEAMPREDVEDVFSSAYMQNKRFDMPSMCPSDHDFTLPEMEPQTPVTTGFPEVKTPQCLHITPGMMGSPNRNNDDKYVFQLQKRMKKNQFNVYKQAPSSKSFTPTPSVKRTMQRCANTENDTFLVWEMFPGNDVALSESGEEEDFYFSDSD